MQTNFSITLLSAKNILEAYYTNNILSEETLKSFIFTQSHLDNPWAPDYIYKNGIKAYWEDKTYKEMILSSLKQISKPLYFRGENIYVESKFYEQWQDQLLSIAPLIPLSFNIFTKSKESFRNSEINLISTNIKQSLLPSIYEPAIELLIEEKGINEMHMHLNGTSEIDYIWCDALRSPSKFYKEIKESFNSIEVKEQYHQIGNFSQTDIYYLLQIARKNRDSLLYIIENKKVNSKNNNDLIYTGYKIHPMEQIERIDNFSNIQYESLFLIRAFEELLNNKSEYFTFTLHYYLLLYAYVNKLLVQQRHQVGFDQFQKITINGLREYSEKEYKKRFSQLKGFNKNYLSNLEGRFAPKNSKYKLVKLLKQIVKGYKKEGSKFYELTLVPHFTKELDKRNYKDIITFRDLKKRLDNKQRLEILLNTMNKKDKKGKLLFGNYISGFDVAANELHSKPEVFSPIFRKLSFLGYYNFTYHAGEDYIHLLSGIRTIYEAIEFLEMKSGNRIGHATALGIEPKLWENRIGKEGIISIEQGEWLDNLIFTYLLLINMNDKHQYIQLLENEIKLYFTKIYTDFKDYFTIHDLIDAWKLRKYDPLIAFEWREPSIFEEYEKKEFLLLQDAKLQNQKAFDIFTMYHESNCIKEYSKIIKVSTSSVIPINIIRELQIKMIELLNEKNIAIESLPTSNLRISFYKEYSEHHIKRWLGLNNKNDPIPSVVLGSDDPGIFATNLKNEYCHVFQMIEKDYGKKEAENCLEYLRKNSIKFAFK